MYDFRAQQDDELSFCKHDILKILQTDEVLFNPDERTPVVDFWNSKLIIYLPYPGLFTVPGISYYIQIGLYRMVTRRTATTWYILMF